MKYLAQLFRVSFLIPGISLFAAAPAAALEPSPVAASVPWAIEPGSIVPSGAAPPSAAVTTDLKFDEMFRLPVGARGLEPSPKLLQLDGRRVRMIGYIVDQEHMRSFILAPLPLKLGDEDESLADDLPPGVVFVHHGVQSDRIFHHIPGLLELTGILSIGGFPEADGRVSTVRLTLDPALSQEIDRHVPSQ